MKRSSSLAKVRTYKFKGKVWRYKGPSSWHFVTLPKTLSKKIRRAHVRSEEGWGRLKVIATVKKCDWNTAIWFDTKADSYLLPLKAAVRKQAGVEVGQALSVAINIELETSGILQAILGE